jgi:hypothetical protein
MTDISTDPSLKQASLPSYGQTGFGGEAITHDQTRAVFGQAMGLVALTVVCAALGAYVGRNLSGGMGLLFFIAAFTCLFGLNIASTRGREQLGSDSFSGSA